MQYLYAGRYNRLKYFWLSLLVAVPVFALYVVLGFAFEEEGLGPIFYVITIVALSPMGVKRFHDLDKSGCFYLLFFLPIVNVVLGLILLFKKGTEGPNRYGADPLGKSVSQGEEAAGDNEALKQEKMDAEA